MMSQDQEPRVRDLMAFVDRSPSPYHAVRASEERLKQAGFAERDIRDSWTIEPSEKGYAVAFGGTIVAFEAGTRPPAEAGFLIMGAHTDSPNLRLKPGATFSSEGLLQFDVEVYGSPLLYTWFDRDLSLAGRLGLPDGSSALIDLERPLCRIPSLAIHLDREVGTRGFLPNPQAHLSPLVAFDRERSRPSLLEILSATSGSLSSGSSPAELASAVSFDLCLYDVQRTELVGKAQEFLVGSRLDNLVSCHAALTALIESRELSAATKVLVLYDHEEVGSQSAAGARSALLERLLERICLGYSSQKADAPARAFARSLMISADMAHAVHPNYADRHVKQSPPCLGKGPVIKSNANQAYASEAAGVAAFIQACRRVGASPQFFTSRNDLPCGSTVGPISAARLGIRAVDVGSPMLGMHSIREMAAVSDIGPMIDSLRLLYNHPPEISPRA